MSKLIKISDRASWDSGVNSSLWGHPLQLFGWGELKKDNSWEPYRFKLDSHDVFAQVLLWKIPGTSLRIAYVPRGPVGDPNSKNTAELLGELVLWCKSQKVIYLRIEPAWVMDTGLKRWVVAKNEIQLSKTYTLDLNKTLDQLLEPMAKKTRQYIRKAERDGIKVTQSNDMTQMYELYQLTSARAGFGIHPIEYYQKLMDELGIYNKLYYAVVDKETVAFLWLASSGSTAYELYGGVNENGQLSKANYLLKWHAICDSKKQGMKIYDFNGRLNDGVSNFKHGFAPDDTDYIGSYDYVINKTAYRFWVGLFPMLKPIGRKVKRALGK